MSKDKFVKVNNTEFYLTVISAMKKEDFIKQHQSESIDVEDCWKQLQALIGTPSKKK